MAKTEQTVDRKEIKLTVKVAFTVVTFLIMLTASAVTTWAILVGKVNDNTEAILENGETLQRVELESKAKDARHIELINDRIREQRDIEASVVGLEKDIKYIIMMLEDWRRE